MKSLFLGGVVAFLVFALTGIPQGPARADIGVAPPSPSGSSLLPPEGASTNVRMVAEEVNLTVESLAPSAQPVNGYHMHALVEAVFHMRNLGETDEAMDVWFPLAASLRDPGSLPQFPENTIRDFKVWIDQKQAKTTQVNAPDVGDPNQQSPWARFPVAFPAGQDVTVRVTYTLYPSGRGIFGNYEYILQTGAGWKDTIGRAEISIHFPYPLTSETVSLSERSIEGYPIAPQPSGYTIENDQIRWELTGLEPGSQDNIFINVLEPDHYQKLIQARSQVAAKPDSAEAQLELARATQGVLVVIKGVWGNGGGPALAEQVTVAYRRALELAPEQASIYLEYMNWLLMSGGWQGLLFNGTCSIELCDLLDRGLKLFPDNAELTKLNEDIRTLQTEAAFSQQAAIAQTATAHAFTEQATGEAEVAAPTAEASHPSASREIPIQTPSSTPITSLTPLPPVQSPDRSNVISWLPPLFIAGAAFVVLLGWRIKSK